MPSREEIALLQRIKAGPLIVWVEVADAPGTYTYEEVDTWDDAVIAWVEARRTIKDSKVFICMPVKLEMEAGLYTPPDNEDEEDFE